MSNYLKQFRESNEERWNIEINSRLWYAHGAIEPTSEEMTRMVTSMKEYLASEFKQFVEGVRKECGDLRDIKCYGGHILAVKSRDKRVRGCRYCSSSYMKNATLDSFLSVLEDKE